MGTLIASTSEHTNTSHGGRKMGISQTFGEGDVAIMKDPSKGIGECVGWVYRARDVE